MEQISNIELIKIIIEKLSTANITILVYLIVGSWVFHKFCDKNMKTLIKTITKKSSETRKRLEKVEKDVLEIKEILLTKKEK